MLTKKLYIKDNSKKELLTEKLYIAYTPYLRLKGLIGLNHLEKNEALLLYPCNSIHMLFMRFPIDAVFLDKNRIVLKIVKNLRPWRLESGHRKAKYTIEFPAKTVNFDVGDELFYD